MSSPLSLSYRSTLVASQFVPTSSSRSTHHPRHPTTPGVDASRVVATGSERSNLPCVLHLPWRLIMPSRLLSRIHPLSFIVLHLSFFLPSELAVMSASRVRSAHAHASIRDNKRVRRAGGDPRAWSARVFPDTRMPARMRTCTYTGCTGSSVRAFHANTPICTQARRNGKDDVDDAVDDGKRRMPGVTSRYHAACFQGHTIGIHRKGPTRIHLLIFTWFIVSDFIED